MGIKFDALKVGDVLYYTFRRQVGHTAMLEDAHESVKIVSISHNDRTFEYSCRGTVRRACESKLSNWRRSKPQYRESITGRKIRVKNYKTGVVSNEFV